MQPEYEYLVTFLRGSRCIGSVCVQSKETAKEHSRVWNAHGEGHTSRVELREKVVTEHAEPIPTAEYLTQGRLRDIFR
jgi:hypothetical protein